MFAILDPISLAPLIATLLWAEWKAKRLGLIGPTVSPSPTPIDDSKDHEDQKSSLWFNLSRRGNELLTRVARTSSQLDVMV